MLWIQWALLQRGTIRHRRLRLAAKTSRLFFIPQKITLDNCIFPCLKKFIALSGDSMLCIHPHQHVHILFTLYTYNNGNSNSMYVMYVHFVYSHCCTLIHWLDCNTISIVICDFAAHVNDIATPRNVLQYK